MAALALSASRHGPLQNKSTHVQSAAHRRAKNTHAKKTRQRRKKTLDSPCLQEDPSEENALSERLIYRTIRTAMAVRSVYQSPSL
jgi:hypothetical protein